MARCPQCKEELDPETHKCWNPACTYEPPGKATKQLKSSPSAPNRKDSAKPEDFEREFNYERGYRRQDETKSLLVFVSIVNLSYLLFITLLIGTGRLSGPGATRDQLQSRENELDTREEKLYSHEQSVDKREASVSSREESVKEQERELENREQSLKEELQTFQQLRQTLASEASKLNNLNDLSAWPPPVPSALMELTHGFALEKWLDPPWDLKSFRDQMLRYQNLMKSFQSKNLAQVHLFIRQQLQNNGHSRFSYFRTPDNGIAMLTQLEGIQKDGSPLPKDRRWILETEPLTWSSFSLSRYFAILTKRDSGFYRSFLFIFGDRGLAFEKRATLDLLSRLIDSGSPIIPEEVSQELQSKLVSQGAYCLALIYEFHQPGPGEKTEFVSGRLSALSHLREAGLLSHSTDSTSNSNP